MTDNPANTDADQACDCMVCDLRRLIVRRNPDGMTPEAWADALESMARVCGTIVRRMGPEASLLFVAAFNCDGVDTAPNDRALH